MNGINPALLEQLQDLYEQEYGRRLTTDEARAKGLAIIRFMRTKLMYCALADNNENNVPENSTNNNNV